jgi:hypothetical protein
MLVKLNQLVVGGMYMFSYKKGWTEYGGSIPLYLSCESFQPSSISSLYPLEKFVVLEVSENTFYTFSEECCVKVLASSGNIGYFCLTKHEIEVFKIRFKRLDKVIKPATSD